MKMNFVDFNCLFLMNAKMSNADVAILAPVIYDYEERYFEACVAFLTAQEERNLAFEEWSVLLLKKAMELSYLQALVVLHNMEHHADYSPIIYNPILEE